MFWRLRTIGFSAIGLFFHAGIDRAPQRRRVIVRKHVEAGGATSKRPWLAIQVSDHDLSVVFGPQHVLCLEPILNGG
jgi:hypothetical protein